jgi:hypothetical protein
VLVFKKLLIICEGKLFGTAFENTFK